MSLDDDLAELERMRQQIEELTIERDALREQLLNATNEQIRLRGQVNNLIYQGQQ